MTTRLAPGSQLGSDTPDPEGEVIGTSQWPVPEDAPAMPFNGGVQDLEHVGQTRREEPDASKRRKGRRPAAG